MNPNDKTLISFLDHYGHLKRPFGEQREVNDLDSLTLNSQIVRDALESYQSFHTEPLERIALGIFGTGGKLVTGELDNPTKQLLSTARCDCPDYSSMEMEAGNGSWDGCHNIGMFHCATVQFMNNPPAHVAPLFDTIWERVVDAYAEVGLLFKKAGPSDFVNIEVTFVELGGSTIGLAIVGQNEGCQSQIWARFAPSYKPANVLSEWTTLIKHELGHNCGLQHSQGGVMNPYIIAGLPVSWKGDVSYTLLANRFGGTPIPRTPTSRTLVLAWQLGPNQFEVIKTLDTNNPPGGIFQS